MSNMKQLIQDTRDGVKERLAQACPPWISNMSLTMGTGLNHHFGENMAIFETRYAATNPTNPNSFDFAVTEDSYYYLDPIVHKSYEMFILGNVAGILRMQKELEALVG